MTKKTEFENIEEFNTYQLDAIRLLRVTHVTSHDISNIITAIKMKPDTVRILDRVEEIKVRNIPKKEFYAKY